MWKPLALDLPQHLQTDLQTKKMQELGVAIHMASANEMITEISVDQLKQMITSIGGFVNFQVKFEGKAAKSYLLPQHEIPGKILERWRQCKSSDYGMHCLNLNYCISVTRNTPSEDVQYRISSEESSAGDMPLCDEVRVKKKTLRKRREVQRGRQNFL